MKRSQGVLAILAIFVITVDGRAYYLQNADGNRYNDLVYPVSSEQSSRDLDLSFSAGDDELARSAKKVYTLVAPEKQHVEVKKEESPIGRYRLVEVPVKSTGLDDVLVLPEQSRKTVKIDGKDKGEVILELRVIANHDSA